MAEPVKEICSSFAMSGWCSQGLSCPNNHPSNTFSTNATIRNQLDLVIGLLISQNQTIKKQGDSLKTLTTKVQNLEQLMSDMKEAMNKEGIPIFFKSGPENSLAARSEMVATILTPVAPIPNPVKPSCTAKK